MATVTLIGLDAAAPFEHRGLSKPAFAKTETDDDNRPTGHPDKKIVFRN